MSLRSLSHAQTTREEEGATQASRAAGAAAVTLRVAVPAADPVEVAAATVDPTCPSRERHRAAPLSVSLQQSRSRNGASSSRPHRWHWTDARGLRYAVQPRRCDPTLPQRLLCAPPQREGSALPWGATKPLRSARGVGGGLLRAGESLLGWEAPGVRAFSPGPPLRHLEARQPPPATRRVSIARRPVRRRRSFPRRMLPPPLLLALMRVLVRAGRPRAAADWCLLRHRQWPPQPCARLPPPPALSLLPPPLGQRPPPCRPAAHTR